MRVEAGARTMHVGVMPEGHTIHRAARDQMLALGGQSVRVTSPQGRFDTTKLSALGRVKLLRVEAYGKHLFYVFEKKLTVHVHLGLFGKFYRHKTPAPPPRDTVRMRMEGDVATIDLVGPTACALVSASEKSAILARIGPDPLNADADPNIFYDAIAKSKAPIGALLMDQSVVSGIGNVYRAEVLHLLKIHPEIPGRAISPKTAKKMWTLMVGLLARGVEEKRIVTTQGLKIAKGGKRMLRSESVHVYRRSTCRSCGGNVQKYLLRARSAYVCTACQPYRSAV